MRLNVPTTFADIRTWVRTAATVLNNIQEPPTVLGFRPVAEPTTPVDGMLYVDEGTGKLRFRQGGAWIDLT